MYSLVLFVALELPQPDGIWMYAVFYYLLVNLICFALFTWDKVAARRHQSRIAETTLHLWTILGGAAGALCARQIFRHKTQKALFTLIIWVSLILHSLIIIAICTQLFDTSPYFRY